jgi:homoserine kinase type II
MAVYTKLEESEMRKVIELYEVGDLKGFTGITKGIMNSNYLVTTDSGKYILRILEMDRDTEEEQKELHFLEYLSSNNIPCPGVVLTKKSEDYIFIKGKMASLFTFLEGKEVLDINSEILYKIGGILAKMHNLSEGMNLTRNEKIELEYLYEFISKDEIRLKEILAENYSGVSDKLKNIRETDFSNLPSGIIHNDIFPDNVFVKDGKITGLIDFNDAMTAPFIHDVSIVMNFWIYGKFGSYKKELCESFLKGYEEVRGLTEEEKSYLPISLDKAALTFVFLRIKKFNYHDGEAEREFKDYRDLLPMVFENKNIEFFGKRV